MTFEQLRIFVAVAERQHLTRAAEALGLTPSAVSSAIKTLEAYYNVELFHRVGRGIELTESGRVFVQEARATLNRVRSAELILSEMGGLTRGEIRVFASQTIASYWLPPILMQFKQLYPGVSVTLEVGNTRTVTEAVLKGLAEIGFIEGHIDEPALSVRPVVSDKLLVVAGPLHPFADGRHLTAEDIKSTNWVLREQGSGTRSAFEAALAAMDISLSDLNVTLELPSNEAVVAAARAGGAAAVVSASVASLMLRQGLLARAGIDLPARQFALLTHKERRSSRASMELERLSRESSENYKAGLAGL
ncbi:LysR family transcriptional regulator [Agrobacterium larrymoorei]|uniref:HTH-type transcriptional regulator TtuA n=1 Tax=Agrobacterium larrymoorei TaxID=160699 RepID=A0A4D7DTG5_9HYPH|nr:LysR substrate-binding domain-containing protein [Agrobacterium larrymoorei]QCI98634.1 LysR family transcriptional regulator [Agrobacterium larrymoorei]QYA05901.1 LysR family transcriptional regulator [Agrobacterium larrymoorei]